MSSTASVPVEAMVRELRDRQQISDVTLRFGLDLHDWEMYAAAPGRRPGTSDCAGGWSRQVFRPRGPDESPVRPSCVVQPPQGGLLGGERPPALIRVAAADFPELSRLLPVPDADFPHPPRLTPLLQGRVVEPLVIPQALGRAGRLPRGRVNAELKRAPHRERSLRHWRSYRVPVCRRIDSADTASAGAAKYSFGHRAESWVRGCGNSERSACEVCPLN